MNWREYNVVMAVLQSKALKMRLKGFSYNEINKTLGIPKSTLSNWFSDISLPEDAKKRLASRVYEGTLNGLVKRNKLQTTLAVQRAKETKQKTAILIKSISEYDLLIIGSVIYWGEGYKRLKVIDGKERTNHIISLTNSDPVIISTFILFLEKVLKISKDKIKLNIRIFKHNSPELVKKYWQSVTGLKESNIEKPVVVISKSSQGKRPFNRLEYGTVQVRVSSTEKFYEIMGMIEGIKNQLDSYTKLN